MNGKALRGLFLANLMLVFLCVLSSSATAQNIGDAKAVGKHLGYVSSAPQASAEQERVDQATLDDPFSATRIIKTVLALVFVCALAVLVLPRLGPYLAKYGATASVDARLRSGPSALQLISRTALDQENQLLEFDTDSGERLLFSSGRGGVVFHGFIAAGGRFHAANSKESREREAEIHDSALSNVRLVNDKPKDGGL